VLDQRVDHGLVGVAVFARFLSFKNENFLAFKSGRFVREGTEFVYGVRNFRVSAEGRDVGDVVFLPVARSGTSKL
jgi:hypothetical protein